MLDLQEKIAAITGRSGGIGPGVAEYGDVDGIVLHVDGSLAQT